MIDLAVRKKVQQENTRKYWEQVNREPEQVRYTAPQMQNHFLRQYEAMKGVRYELDEYTQPIIHALCLYFTDDVAFERLGDGYSLSKGILLQGNVGCGKSSVMRVFQENQKQSFAFKSCVDISREFSQEGYKMFQKYANPQVNRYQQSFFGQANLGWCFDDLGFETTGRHYGKSANVMLEIIQSLYDDNTRMKGMVHFTTNLTADDIKEAYGTRISSRLREMLNVLDYSPDAPDRRR